MKIGQVAKLLDMPVETIRFYEKNQILSPERKENSTYREFEVCRNDISVLYARRMGNERSRSV